MQEDDLIRLTKVDFRLMVAPEVDKVKAYISREISKELSFCSSYDWRMLLQRLQGYVSARSTELSCIHTLHILHPGYIINITSSNLSMHNIHFINLIVYFSYYVNMQYTCTNNHR